MRQSLGCLLLLFASAVDASPLSIDNDAGCDISNLPAATLLLPYFEVDVQSPAGRGHTTIFTITNTSHMPQIARVTLWTDAAHPVYSFNVFLTGYDVQSINLYDIFIHGRTGDVESREPGGLSLANNPLVDEETCATMPAELDDAARQQLLQVFTKGKGEPGCATVGGTHTHPSGYATIDVVGSCNTTMPGDRSYFSEDIRFDNVLIGDYAHVDGDDDSAEGGPMVHIRAIPEGGRPRDRKVDPRYEVTLAHTFYERQPKSAHPRFDARQPLPSVFAARWIDGGATDFRTYVTIWREGLDATGACAGHVKNLFMPVVDIVRFDDEENPTSLVTSCEATCIDTTLKLPSSKMADADDLSVFPDNPDDAVTGWMYLNLGSGDDGRPSEQQAWVVSSMRAEGRYSVELGAQAMGNGCSPVPRVADEDENPIRPLPAGTANDATCDIAALPAATLLVPFFAVDVYSPSGPAETTILTVTNVSQLPQVARVTLWTDMAYPVFAFNVYLTGYDAQSINLYDVIGRGLLVPDAGTGSAISPVGVLSGTSATSEYDNPLLDERSCASAAPVALAPALAERMRLAFTLGRIPGAATNPRCSFVGGTHSYAVGYATIDVVGSCSTSLPTDRNYFTEDIRYDNVLLGEYMQISSANDFAQGNTMVHIRAIPEGGDPRSRRIDPHQVTFPNTFYGAYQGNRPGADARQPLPSVFAARWISGGPGEFETFYKIWRQGPTTDSLCGASVRSEARFVEAVRFDEDENPQALSEECQITCVDIQPYLLATTLAHTSDSFLFPQSDDDAVGGWMYLNLDDVEGNRKTSQAWVVTSMRAEGRFSVDMDAAALGNGCSAPVAESNAHDGRFPIGPLPNKRD